MLVTEVLVIEVLNLCSIFLFLTHKSINKVFKQQIKYIECTYNNYTRETKDVELGLPSSYLELYIIMALFALQIGKAWLIQTIFFLYM
jgi:hypothetical protein